MPLILLLNTQFIYQYFKEFFFLIFSPVLGYCLWRLTELLTLINFDLKSNYLFSCGGGSIVFN